MQHARHNRLRHAAVYLALALVFGVGSCRVVGDNVTGVRLFRGQPTTCIKQCNDQYKLLFDEELRLHQTNVENCQALPQPQRGQCLEEEDARHDARMEQLGQDKIACQNNCHHQGSGSIGP